MKPTAYCDKLLLLGLLLTACDRATTLEYEDEKQPEATCTIARLKSLCDGQRYPIVDQTVVRGTVTGNNRYGEFYQELIIQDATGGLAIAADYPAADNAYPLGEEVIVYCNGLTLYDYGGKIELGKVTAESTRIPREEVGKYLHISGQKPGRIAATPVRIGDLNPGHIDTYVRIDNVRFAEAAAWCDRDPETGRYMTTERQLEDADGNTLAVRTLGSALQAGEPLPEGRGSLCGIVDRFDGCYTLRITGLETAFVATPAAPATTCP